MYLIVQCEPDPLQIYLIYFIYFPQFFYQCIVYQTWKDLTLRTIIEVKSSSLANRLSLH